MENTIFKKVETILPQDLYCIKVKVSKNNNNITVYLDGDYGVSIEDCGQISHQLKEWLDEKPEIPEDYTLNVSSAGLSEPLKWPRQYKKNVNRDLKIRVSEAEIKGRLIYADEKKIWLKTGKKENEEFTINQIDNAIIDV